jgi:lipid A ethanolaminephosphotransferase
MRAAPRDTPAANPLLVALLAALWIASVGNWPLWQALLRLPELASLRGAVFMLGFAGIIAALTFALLALAAWRSVVKVAAGVFLLAAAAGAHFMGAYGVVLDPTMMTNVLQTDPHEAADLLTPSFFINLLLIGVLPLVWLARLRVRRLSWPAQAWRNAAAIVGALLLIAALIFALFADLSSTMRNHRTVRYMINPVNAFWSLAVLGVESNARPAGPLQPIGLDARPRARPAGARPPLVVLVVGETARADHFSLNGYRRPTNPELERLGVASFRDASSCGTSTAASLPCMFSPLGRSAFGARQGDSENLLDLVHRAGLAVLWLDNQAGCKGLCDRVPHADANQPPTGAPNPPAALCGSGECYDMALLWHLDARLEALPAERRARGVLLVLHQMGSQGPAYYKRSPPDRKPFQPECRTAVLQDCSREAIVGAYDNSIAYTDHVLAQTIAWLQRRSAQYDPALLYVSDHGESLGENNLYLHGMPYAFAPREQKHVAMIAWTGAGSWPSRAVSTACLREHRDESLSHDNPFSTVVGALDIETNLYTPTLDVFAPCRGH